jgi:hypothetical protein
MRMWQGEIQNTTPYSCVTLHMRSGSLSDLLQEYRGGGGRSSKTWQIFVSILC